MKVVYFHRKPFEGYFSIEKEFQTIREALPEGVEPFIAESNFYSKGILRRSYNILEAVFRQKDVNHIAGDVHFVSYLLKKKKTILTIHDCVFAEKTSGLRRFAIKLFWYVIPVKRVAIITVISESTKNELKKFVNVPSDKIYVIPVCIPNSYKYSEYVFNSQKPRLLQIGTSSNKNIVRLARALKGISCHLDIVGKITKEQEKVLLECGIEYSNIWNISEEELIKKYHGCDLVIFVSTYEGFGMPILEGNAVGRPVVTSNIYSMPEVSSDAACLVNPYSEEEIRNGIIKVIENNFYRQELIQNGLRNVQRFRPEDIANKYVELYHKVMFNQAKNNIR